MAEAQRGERKAQSQMCLETVTRRRLQSHCKVIFTGRGKKIIRILPIFTSFSSVLLRGAASHYSLSKNTRDLLETAYLALCLIYSCLKNTLMWPTAKTARLCWSIRQERWLINHLMYLQIKGLTQQTSLDLIIMLQLLSVIVFFMLRCRLVSCNSQDRDQSNEHFNLVSF